MVVTLCTEDDVKDKAGANVSSAFVTANYTRAINRAEAKLSAVTRKDWVTLHATLAANIKQFLADYVSSKAAKEAINYDMSGYTSRIEAQTMLDVNDDIANEALKELNNKIVTDWMVKL